MFSDYDLTMVNVFATWCSPCVNELPDLQKLSEETKSDKDKKIQIVGVVLDTVGANGETDSDALEKARHSSHRYRSPILFWFRIPKI